MIGDSEIGARAGSCCAANSRIGGMRQDLEYDATATRAGADDAIKFNYWFECLQCSRTFGAYVVCSRNDWPPLAEYVDLKTAVPPSQMALTFAELKL